MTPPAPPRDLPTSPGERLALVAYAALLYALLPAQLLRLWWRGRRLPGYRRRWRERLALAGPLPLQPRIWLHAVSVGETLAAAPLIRALLEDHPGHRLLVTTTTPTGSAQVQRLFGERVEHRYFPWDLPDVVHRFLDHTRPRLFIVMETELWPNVFRQCRRRGIPVLVVNARLSARSFAGYRRLRPLLRPTLRAVDTIAAQGQDDADRFLCLGAPHRRVAVYGNLKFDLDLPDETVQAGRTLRQALGGQRPVWIAASTHPDEEAVMLAAHRALLARRPDALLILVPRHPERFDGVARLCAGAGLAVARRSRGEAVTAATRVYLGDTMGELLLLYGAADVAVVGGSFVPVGGHNPLEPAAHALPILTGPHIANFRDIYQALFRQQAALTVRDAEQLAARLGELLADPPRRAVLGQHARALLSAHRGTRDRLRALIEQRLN